MKYFLKVTIEPSSHYIHVKGKIEDMPGNTLYLNENFTILWVKADNRDATFTMDKTAPHPEFDQVSRPVLFETESKSIEFEYEGCIDEVIFDVNQIDEDLVELASYAGWYFKPDLGTVFDFDVVLNLPPGYELASNGTIHFPNHITSSDSDTSDIVLFASNQVKRVVFDEGVIKLVFLCPDEMLPNMERRAKDIAKANAFFTEKFGEITVRPANEEIISVFRPRGGWGYKRGKATFMSSEHSKNKTEFTGDIHELAHGWWSIANVATNDWINEGGAEFSAYAASKLLYGSTYAEQLVKKYIDGIHKTESETSIVDTTSASPDRYVNHYYKTTMMLIKASKLFGEEAVFSLLKNLYQRYAGTRNATTEGFLALCNPEMRAYFEKMLVAVDWKDIDLEV